MTKNKIADLPSAEEIYNYANGAVLHPTAFVSGAIWMQDTYAKPLLEKNKLLRTCLETAVEFIDWQTKYKDAAGTDGYYGQQAFKVLSKIKELQSKTDRDKDGV